MVNATNITRNRLKQLLPQLFEPAVVTGDPYLRLQLTSELPALLSMKLVQEALLVPSSVISPLPNMPSFTIGMLNIRDRVLMVVDFGELLGLPPMRTNPREYQVITIELPTINKYLGLAVHRIRGVTRHPTAIQLSPAHKIPSCLEPYVLGSLVEEGTKVSVLDSDTISSLPAIYQNHYV